MFAIFLEMFLKSSAVMLALGAIGVALYFIISRLMPRSEDESKTK